MAETRRDEWKWRASFAVLGTLGYWPLFHPDWRNPFLVLYDVPTLLAAWGFVGSLVWHAAQGRSRQIIAPTLACSIAVLCAAGAQFAHWPLSGHLTVATTVGILEAGDPRNPARLRIAVPVPIVLLILIRTFWPQMPQMDNVGNTIRALCVGLLLGKGVQVFGVRY